MPGPAIGDSSSSTGTLGNGELTIAHRDPADDACAGVFDSGEVVDISGDGFAPGATVTLRVMVNRSDAVQRLVTADASGSISMTVALPDNLTGVDIDGSPAAYAEADGPGGSATDQSDNALFGVGVTGASCRAVVNLNLTLTAFELPDSISKAGGVFALIGPGLPALASSHAPGTFAELDTDARGQSICPAREPAKLTCSDGAVGPLVANATYTVVEISAPPQFATAPPKTITVDDGSFGTDGIEIDNKYVGDDVTASLAVRVDGPDGRRIPGRARFEVTGPGLPAYRYPASAGVVAELDTDAAGRSVCPAREPAGVICEGGTLRELHLGGAYLVTQVAAPAGYAIAGGQRITAANGRNVTTVIFIDNPTEPSPANS